MTFLSLATVFLSAFLLFQIQPMIGKMILPWFGGASSVWSTCMLFFQVVLLLGYVYAHWLLKRFSPRRAAAVHSVVLAASLFALPIAANPSWKPVPGSSPSLRILGLLAVTVGLPYFAVSTTSSLVQAWYARAHGGAAPYRLFALSNLASILALLTYPWLVEPSLTTRAQAGIWSAGYGCFALLCATTAWIAGQARAPAPNAPEGEIDCDEPPPIRTRVLWAALAACASILLLSATTFLTQDVGAIPFLWIVPLAIYLLSFILCFNAEWMYQRWIYVPWAIAGLAITAYRLHPSGWRAPVVPTLWILTLSLFGTCMFCHGELVRRKPLARFLTGFYVAVALGGAAGGLFVGLLAPNVFNAYYEFPIGLAMCAALLLILIPRPARFPRLWSGAAGVLFATYTVYLGMGVRQGIHNYRVVERNFYGQLRVLQRGQPGEEDASRVLLHGLIDHGEQMLNEEDRRKPITYFCPESGIGRLMSTRPAVPQRVGVMGMGCGTLAAYGRRGDTYRIYEINSLVPGIAQTQFTYLSDSPARIEIALGDARLSLEREPDQQFDVLVMDAFSGDSVPVHLITREAFQMYSRHLKPGGVIAVNITNNYLDLRPVIERAASSLGKVALVYQFVPDDDDELCYKSTWTLIADPSIRRTMPGLVQAGEILSPRPGFRMWTDDYSSLWGILR